MMMSNKNKIEEIRIACQWKNCCFVDNSSSDFSQHIKQHIPQLEVVTNNEGEESYQCLWLNCIFQTIDAEEVVWHVKYHGYHCILKAKGDAIANSRNLQECTLSETECNSLPTRLLPLICLWDSCYKRCTGQIEFIEHVNYNHIRCLESKSKERVKCEWADCSLTTTKKSKLADHVKVHTGDKTAACSHCGQIFANSTKFVNHRQRQMPINENSPQCSHCLAYLPNDRLLRIHFRQHVHHYKCCFCELTCSTPSILSAHIKYRHLPYKPFKCSTCAYVGKSQNDLNRHMTVHLDSVYPCTHEGCNRKFRTEFSLATHFEEHTQNIPVRYECHLCTETFSRGSKLTVHLCKDHNVTKPSGYSRFEYRREKDGIFRLQTTRLESLEIEVLDASNIPFAHFGSEIGAVDNSEEVDERSPIDNENEDSQRTIALDLIDEEGKIITTEVTTEVDLPPEAKVVAVGE